MPRRGRRIRGWLIRLALARRRAIVAGLILAAPAAVVLVGDYSWERWYTDGLGVALGATGVSLLVMGLGGRRPDWIDPAAEDLIE